MSETQDNKRQFGALANLYEYAGAVMGSFIAGEAASFGVDYMDSKLLSDSPMSVEHAVAMGVGSGLALSGISVALMITSRRGTR